MWDTLRDQFSTTFLCVFLACFLPWTMSWQYLDVPILAVQVLMPLLLLGPVAREFGVQRGTRYGVIFGLGLLAIGMCVFSIHQTIPAPPPWLVVALLAILASASYFVSVVGVVAEHRVKIAAWGLLIGTYFLSGRVVTNEVPLLLGLAISLAGIGYWLLRRHRLA